MSSAIHNSFTHSESSHDVSCDYLLSIHIWGLYMHQVIQSHLYKPDAQRATESQSAYHIWHSSLIYMQNINLQGGNFKKYHSQAWGWYFFWSSLFPGLYSAYRPLSHDVIYTTHFMQGLGFHSFKDNEGQNWARHHVCKVNSSDPTLFPTTTITQVLPAAEHRTLSSSNRCRWRVMRRSCNDVWDGSATRTTWEGPLLPNRASLITSTQCHSSETKWRIPLLHMINYYYYCA